MPNDQKDMDAYLARIRKTIADSENLVAQAELRIAETDRMLERQGLTREQVMAMRFSDAQMEAVNAELKRRGLDPLERWERGEERVTSDEIRVTSDGDGGASNIVVNTMLPLYSHNSSAILKIQVISTIYVVMTLETSELKEE